jgi:hypothetical protein
MDSNDLKIIHYCCTGEQWADAANYALQKIGRPATARNKRDALPILRKLFKSLLDNNKFLEAATLQWGPDVFNTEPESTQRVFKSMQENSMVLLMGASSMSKCLHPETGVMMFDGQIKRAKDISVGDLLMGDDSKPRRVLQRDNGYGPLYRIVPERGKPWICNDAHILSLKCSSTKKCGPGKYDSKKWVKGGVHDINIEDYQRLSKDKKNILKQFHVGVEFPEVEVPFDPYIYGAWLGDGGFDVPALHTPDGPMAKRWVEYFESLPGFKITSGYHDKCPMWCARVKDHVIGQPNPFLDFIRTSRFDGEKIIRSDYLINSRKNRLKLLAGLIDSDGWVSCKSGYQFVSKHEGLANQVMMLARSLGFGSTVTPRVHTIKSIAFSGTYFHVNISGKGITEIPTLEKHASEKTGPKDACSTGFEIEAIGDGDYCGFVIDGNHRFLLEDFTVTHNTYAAGAFILLDYLKDPWFTTVKLAAINEDHLKKNLFAHVAFLFRNMAIPDDGTIEVMDAALWMGIKKAGYEFGISGLAFKQSQETSGQFKGYKAKPVNRTINTKLGKLSRLRVLGDEGQNWPGGPFQDFNSLKASISGADLIKIVVAFNPETVSQHVVQMAEPEDGWSVDQLDVLYDYDSKAGWRVCRLDAALCENVKQKKVVYHGLQTYEGFMSFLKAGGDSSAQYMTFARGIPPLKGNSRSIIPPTWPQEARGEAIFIETPINVAAVDLAFMGNDTAQMAVGRWGLASGYSPQNVVIGKDGTPTRFIPFFDRTNIGQSRPRHVLQIDQLIPLTKHDDTIKMAQEIISRCNQLGVKPEHCAVDKTSIGLGTYDHLRTVWGDCIGVQWSEGATDMKILAEDTDSAKKQCDGIMSEMWWAFRRWIDPTVRAILINPIIPPQPIQTQMSSRQFETGKNGIKVESKEKYKARNKSSPDESDALIQLCHVVRCITDTLPGMVERPKMTQQVRDELKPTFTTPAKQESTEEHDSIFEDGVEEEEEYA